MNSDQVARMFFDRLPDSGGWISAKQAKWLYDVAQREIERSGYHGPLRDAANRKQVAGSDWTLTIAPNGAGMLRRI